MNADFDIAVIGSGFGGSLIAMIARKLGRSVILIERGRHPRFAIGESTTPLANLLLEEIAQRYDLPRLLPLSKWGSWQRVYPQLACGLKRGFTFYQHRLGQRFAPDPDRTSQLLVAASPRDEIADTHWYRPHFDDFLVREAQTLGAEYIDEVRLGEINPGPLAMELKGQRHGRQISVRAGFVIDASGPRGCLHRMLGLPEQTLRYLPHTQGLFSHFSDVERLDRSQGRFLPTGEAPPYPVDDAAVHHVFEGGWIWVLRFNNGLVSAGVSATDRMASDCGFSTLSGEIAWQRLLQQLPTVHEQFSNARAELPFSHLARLGFRSGVITGPRWALLPSAAGFIDPLLSTGFPLTLLGILRLAEVFNERWQSDHWTDSLELYAHSAAEELLAAEMLVAALYLSFKDFSTFVQVALLYFAAVSFSETARRLGRAELARGFLLREHAVFGPRLRACCELVLGAQGNLTAIQKAELQRWVAQAIEPIDVAGLHKKERRNWHPVDLSDLLASADKLGVGVDEIERLLVRCNLVSPP
jgi:tetracycline 7-halogenase / FADH2 O2-dependent halogenase